MVKKIYIIAGEASGDFIGAKLIEQLQGINHTIIFKGIGGEMMNKAWGKNNVTSLFPISEIAIMGFIEVFFKIFRLKKLINKTIADITSFQPDVLITIDSLGFNKRVVSALRKNKTNLKYVHYVAPSVWAWKPERAKEIAKLYDYQLCLFDFEPSYFNKYNVKTVFVGHPIIESGAENGNAKNIINKYNLDENYRYIILMPGSRISEISRLLPIFIQVAKKIQEKLPNTAFILPTILHLKPYISTYLNDKNLNYLIIDNIQDKYDSFSLAKLAIVASGTATLELSLAKLPCIVAYKVNYLTAKIVRFLVKIKYASIINIINNKEIIKEFIQEKCTVEAITEESLKLLAVAHTNTSTMDKAIDKTLKQLGYLNFIPSQKAAGIIEDILNQLE